MGDYRSKLGIFIYFRLMEVRSNRIGDIRSHYRRKLMPMFSEREADSLLFMVLMEYTGLTKAGILAQHEEAVSESQLLKIHFSVKELLKNKPVQYVLGKTEFYGLPFIVNSKVLIPRPETEEMVEWIIREMKNKKYLKIIDLGTGSGCIGITLKKHFPDSIVTAVDLSDFALEVAAANADLNSVVVDFERFDMLQVSQWKQDEVYDLIVSNPPYVRNLEKKDMKENVLEFEPETALFVDDEDPLIFYQGIINFADQFLSNQGWVFCEINQYLHEAVYDLFSTNGFTKIVLKKDFRNNYRFLSCCKKK